MTKVVAERVKELRRRRDWSAARLAEEMTSAGQKWERTTVANLENGRRRFVTVDELLVLAQVLEVSPLVLLLPKEDAIYQVSANVTARAVSVLEWLVGERIPLEGGEDELSNQDRQRALDALKRDLPYAHSQTDMLMEVVLDAVYQKIYGEERKKRGSSE